LLRAVCVEDRFNGPAEEFRDFERKGEAGRVFSGFKRIDRLPSDSEHLRYVRLRPIAFSAQNFDAIPH
jgi:hypothetical protein